LHSWNAHAAWRVECGERIGAELTTTIEIAAVIGSLRKGSFHRILFEAACSVAPAGVEISEVSVEDLPFYNGDLEDAGVPDTVSSFQDAVAGATGLLVFTPEYNGSIPAVTKNAVDWLTRPYGSAPLSGKPVGVVAATPGRHDAAGVRDHLNIVVGANTDRLFPESLGLSSISRRVEGRELQADALEELSDWLTRFANFIAAG